MERGQASALVDPETWDACQHIRVLGRGCNTPVRERWSYPLTPILRCAKCGGTMHGESVTVDGRVYLYYASHQARRETLGRLPDGYDPLLAVVDQGGAYRGRHRRQATLLPPGRLHGRAVPSDPPRGDRQGLRPAQDRRGRIRRLDEQLERAKRLYEYGEDTWETDEAKRTIRAEQQRIRDEAALRAGVGDAEGCQRQVVNLLATWGAADQAERLRLLGTMVGRIEAEGSRKGRRLRFVGVRRRDGGPSLNLWHPRETPLVRGNGSFDLPASVQPAAIPPIPARRTDHWSANDAAQRASDANSAA